MDFIQKELYKLDDPVFYSLQEVHHHIAHFHFEIAFYNPDYAVFGGTQTDEDLSKAIKEYLHKKDFLYWVGKEPKCGDSAGLLKALVCEQMILTTPIDIPMKNQIVAMKLPAQKEAVGELVNLVQSGYFREKTIEMGTYYGIYDGGQLVATAGERMKMNRFTEISALVTHPEHRRKTYAKQLIKQLTDVIFEENKLPYLHVLETNTKAIKLYQKMGFRSRNKICFWKLTPTT